MHELRILTVRQPWAWAIIHGGKDVENRVRNIAGSYRGPVAIHAASGATALLTAADQRLLLEHDLDGKVDGWLGGEPIEGGVILGVVDLVDVHEGPVFSNDDCTGRGNGPMCSPWAERGRRHLVLANPRALADPIPFRGALGLRWLDEETTAAVWAQIGGAS